MAVVITLVIVCVICSAFVPSTGSQSCDGMEIAMYNLTVMTFWSRDVFPKQYPRFRPHAQWSTLVGRSHNANYQLWSAGELSAPAVKAFIAEKDGTLLQNDVQGDGGILDVFTAPSIPTGDGTTSVVILASHTYSLVSFMVRMIPSPDWFIGVDSINLCKNGRLAEQVEVDLDPWDAGVEQGFTFTSPRYPQYPQMPFTRITPRFERHPAFSFNYPTKRELPRMGRMILTRIRTLKPSSTDPTNATADTMSNGTDTVTPNWTVMEAADVNGADPSHVMSDELTGTYDTESNRSTSIAEGGTTEASITNEVGSDYGDVSVRTTPPPRTQRRRKLKRRPIKKERRYRAPRHCDVSDWSDWGACSMSCGFGWRTRTRSILARPRHGGDPCPELREKELCGSMSSCGWQPFSLSDSFMGPEGGGF